jgi:hypothetical protein
MLRGIRHLGKILGYSFSPIKSFTSRCLDLLRRVGRGNIWRRQWELLENRLYNKSNGCSATGALAPGPDQQLHLQPKEKGLLTFASLPIRWQYSVPARKDNKLKRQFSRQDKCALDILGWFHWRDNESNMIRGSPICCNTQDVVLHCNKDTAVGGTVHQKKKTAQAKKDKKTILYIVQHQHCNWSLVLNGAWILLRFNNFCFYLSLRSMQSVRRYSAIVETGTVSDMQEIRGIFKWKP